MKVGLLSALSFAPLLAALTICAGCTSDGPRSGSATGPRAFASDTAAAAPGAGATVALRAGSADPFAPNRIAVDVVARGAVVLQGAAFRVTWDPGALSFIEAKSGDAWSKHVVALAKEGSPGQLAVAWTEKGDIAIDATGETILGTLLFEPRGQQGTALAFKTERSMLVDKKGAPIVAMWTGGSIAAR